MEEVKAKIAVVQERIRRLSRLSGMSFESYLKDFTFNFKLFSVFRARLR